PVQPQQVNPVNTFGFTNNVVTQDNTVITPVQQPVNPVNTFGVTNNGTQSSTVSTPVQPQPVNTYQNKNNYQSNKKTNNKKPMLLLVIILIAVGIFYYFPSLSGDNSRTIMIYMTGSDLESKSSLATVDLDSIDYDLMDSENINVVVIIGGSESWHNDYTSTDQTSIYELTNDGFVEVKTQELQNMGDDEVLSDFLTYTYDAYKADEYSLIFWNHGAAILGSQSDEIYDDFLDLTEMEQALANSPFNSNNKLENIIFRTCLNGTIEVASVFNDYAQYLVASEEITYGTSYTSVLDFINEIQTSDTAEDVGIKYINSYKEQIEFIEDSYNTEIVSTYSIIDLSKVEETIDAFGEFVNDIDIESNYYQIAKVRSSLFQFAYTTGGDSSYDMVDMYTLVEELSSLSNDKATKVLNLLDEMIVYNWNENVDATGVSIYFPYNASTYIKTYLLSIYSDFTALDDYYSFITEFNTIKTNSFYQYDFSNNVSDTVEADENYDFNLTLTEEQVEYYASSEFFVFRDNGDGTYLPVYLGQQVTLEDNILSSNINDRQLKIVSTDGTQNILTLFENYETTTNLNYNVYISLFNYDTTPMLATSASATIAYNKETSEINLGSIIESNSDEYAASNILLDINDYTSIIFASSSYEIIDENGELRKDWYDYSNGTIEGVSVAPNEFSFELETFDDEYDYYCTFRIYDVYGNHEYSNLIKLEK
ncbi:MAG: clostripain-related cysteine peptidase, partial [Mycoplasmatota bacterium]